jgi:hypothetical protein
MNLREINDDLLQDWLAFREEDLCSINSKEDKKHFIYFDELCEKIINSIPMQNRDYVQRQLNKLNDNFMDYICYWNEKYYRNGFCDGVQLITGCFNK